MPFYRALVCCLAATVLISSVADARTNVVIIQSSNAKSTPDFHLKVISPPSAKDAATNSKISIIDGSRDANGGNVDKLHDGNAPTLLDQPTENFFFAAGTPGGRLAVDLGNTIAIDQVNTYSWHAGPRGPQVYKLYASDGTNAHFDRAPKRGSDPKDLGWTFVASVDTRPADREPGGQYGVSIFDSAGSIGSFRYLLFDIASTENDDPFGNTFYSEIDIVADEAAQGGATPRVVSLETEDGQRIRIDTSQAPDLAEWAEKELAPVVKEWYPKIVKMLPGENYVAPRSLEIAINPAMRGVAATRGTAIQCGANWFRRNLKGEAKGAVVHELVHVAQQYNRAPRNDRNGQHPPGWLVEGIADYIRWFVYEPQSRGAEIDRRNLPNVRYDGSYRVSANFLNWVTEHYDREIVRKLNAALRDGRYQDALWKEWTGHSLEELGGEWKTSIEKALVGEYPERPNGNLTPAQSSAVPPINSLSDKEKSEGWRMLFTGNDFSGWHSFGVDRVRPGWQIKQGTLVCADPHDAGDLCTADRYDWFELKLEYNISEGGNSGIMYHVTDEGKWTWETGPELQLQDNAHAHDPIRSGWLYGLYQPPNDPRTGKPLDATKPAGEWNEVRLLVSPEKCVHEINGVKYCEYVLGSEDLQHRVAQSKFRAMPLFGKSPQGYIALQGDHGQISFRNIRIRPIK